MVGEYSAAAMKVRKDTKWSHSAASAFEFSLLEILSLSIEKSEINDRTSNIPQAQGKRVSIILAEKRVKGDGFKNENSTSITSSSISILKEL